MRSPRCSRQVLDLDGSRARRGPGPPLRGMGAQPGPSESIQRVNSLRLRLRRRGHRHRGCMPVVSTTFVVNEGRWRRHGSVLSSRSRPAAGYGVNKVRHAFAGTSLRRTLTFSFSFSVSVLSVSAPVSAPPSSRISSSSSSTSACSAHQRPAWSASTPVRTTLQTRWEDASSSVGSRRLLGNSGRAPADVEAENGRGSVEKFATRSAGRWRTDQALRSA